MACGEVITAIPEVAFTWGSRLGITDTDMDMRRPHLMSRRTPRDMQLPDHMSMLTSDQHRLWAHTGIPVAGITVLVADTSSEGIGVVADNRSDKPVL